VLARNAVVMPGPTAQLAEYLGRTKAEKASEAALSLASTWLAGTYQLTHRAAAAEALLDRGTLLEQVEPDGTWYWNDLTYRAQVLYVVARHFPARLERLGPTLLQRLAGQLQGVHSLSAGWALYALDAYASALESGAPGAWKEVAVERQDAKGAWTAVALPAGLTARVPFDGATAGLRVSTGSLLFYSLSEGGFDRAPPTAVLRDGVELFHELTDAVGKPVSTLKLGDEVLVKVKTRSLVPGRTLPQMAVVDLLPAGFDLVLSRGSDAQGMARLVSGQATWEPDQLDAREDRVIFYGSILPTVGELTYRLKAVARGRFAVPPASASGMYEPLVQARSLGGVVEVE
jgi:uncharacterized protein YfaS (alpha-2-macroglobulin family)